jgi:hypothetical protein
MKRRRLLISLVLLLIVGSLGQWAYGRWRDEQLRRFLLGAWKTQDGFVKVYEEEGAISTRESFWGQVWSKVSPVKPLWNVRERWRVVGGRLCLDFPIRGENGQPGQWKEVLRGRMTVLDEDHIQVDYGEDKPYELQFGPTVKWAIPFWTRWAPVGTDVMVRLRE